MLFRSNVNDLISRLEQPEKMLNQIIIDMRSQLVKAKQQVAAAIADEKRLQDQTAQELQEAEEWEQRAMLAVKEEPRRARQAGADAPRRARGARRSRCSLTWEAHKQETDRLKDSLRRLNDNIEEAIAKKNLLLAKQRRADAQKRINETMSSISEKSAFEAFARMEEKIDAERAQDERARRDQRRILGRPARERLQAPRGSGRKRSPPKPCSSS